MFEFLKKSRSSDPAATDDPATPAEIAGEPRAHHFTFSQVVVPQVAWRDPMTFFGGIKMDRERFINYLLDVNRDINQKNRDPFRMHAEALAIKTTVIRPWPCILIQMPEPLFVGESYMIALVLLADPKAEERDIDPEKGPGIALFNLDRDQEGTLVSQWRGETRKVHQPGPPPTEERFLHWIAATLADRRG
ncbi:hypothetical protein [Acanthopleuribacter pedis]|uniref:Uncharacterized protein n=1 Tax=Acanthopleuribacter pedis TaxID=442870 RepID=A0A8J7QME8_9BACT|nr:hypothetical protein [Acanthopleuribacter pedis]MBO1321053.1 hypothetical protein [Acanthopleuribacter pedis]